MRSELLALAGLGLVLMTDCRNQRDSLPAERVVPSATTPRPEPSDARFRFAARTEQGVYHCESGDSASTGTEVIRASVLEVAQDSFALDACPPTADCGAPLRSDFSVVAAGFPGWDRTLLRDGFVRVRLEVRRPGGVCRQRLLIESMRSWLGAPNPAGHADGLYFAGAHGFSDVFRGSPFKIELCPQGAPAGAIRLTAPDAEGLLLLPSQLAAWRHRNVEWTARNLTSGQCDPNAVSYWIVGRPPDLEPGVVGR